MPTLTAEIATDRAGRFLRQFCEHAAAMGGPRGHTARTHKHAGPPAEVQLSTERTDTHGLVTFAPWGTCTLTAGPATLTVRIDGVDDDAVQRIRDIVTRDFERFSARNPLTVRWRASGAQRSRLAVIAIVFAVAVLVAVHAGLADAALRSGWTWIALAVVAAALVVKVTLVLLVRARGHRLRRLHHGHASHAENN
jgi:hypothetical protein